MLGRQALEKRPAISGDAESLTKAISDGPKKHRRALSSSSTCKTTTSSSFSSSQKEKKPSFWNWKPLKALSQSRQRRFDLVFSLHVHSVENLPASIANVALSVCWNRTTDPPSAAVGTSPVEAIDGVAEFEETLSHRCSVYGTRKSSKYYAAKYEPRHFLIYVSVVDFPEVNFGRHLVDLTRLLPLNLKDLEEVENSYGRWSTSFPLLGEARGALLNVSFGFSLIGDGSLSSRNDKVLDNVDLKAGDEGSVGRGLSKGRRWVPSHSVDDAKVLHEVLPPYLVNTIKKKDFLKCEEIELCYSQTSSEAEPDVFGDGEFMNSMPWQNDLKDSEFVANKNGIENPERIDDGGQAFSNAEENSNVDLDCRANRLFSAHCLVELKDEEMPSDVLSFGESEGLKVLKSETMAPNQACHAEVRSESKRERLKSESLNLDVTIEDIANEFLDTLGMDHNPSGLHTEIVEISPRERLWKQFEEEIFGSGSVLFGVDIEPEHKDRVCKGRNLSTDSQDYDLSPMLQEAEWVIHKATQGLNQHSGIAFPSLHIDKDFTGQPMQQIAWEVTSMLDSCKRPGSLPYLEREADHMSPQKILDSRKHGANSYLASSINVDGEDETSDRSSIAFSTHYSSPKLITRSCKLNPYLVQAGWKEEEEEAIPQLKVSEMDAAGRKSEAKKEKEWGHLRQQKCGSKWFVARGMGKRYKHPFMKSLAASEHLPANSTVLLGDSLLSISFHVNGALSKWRESCKH